MSWQVKPVGELFRVINGGTPKTGVNAYWAGPHQWVTPAEMGGLDSPYITVSQRTLTDEGLRVGAELVPANSIILSSRAPIGHLVINEVPMAFNQGCKGLVPSNGIAAKFAYYFFLLNVPLLESLGTGTTFKELSGGKLKEVEFRFPELAEQHRIAALLDEAFAGIATARANAYKNLRNAREVSDSISQQVLDSAGGAELSLESVAADDCSLSYGIVQPGNDVEGGLPVVRPVDLTRDVITLDGLKRIDPELALGYQRTKLQGGELLLCVRGTTGTVSIAAPELERGNVTRGIVPIRFKSDRVNPAFGYHLMKSGGVQSQIRERTYGAALMQINIGDLRNIKVKIPPLSEQNELAERLDNLRKGAAHLQSLYTRKLTALEELKQSLLHRAFSGQLT